jgi:hypothetical protein
MHGHSTLQICVNLLTYARLSCGQAKRQGLQQLRMQPTYAPLQHGSTQLVTLTPGHLL